MGGFFNGAISGFITGFSGGLLTETSRGLFQHQGFGQSLGNGLKQGLIGGFSGAVIGGLISGFDALKKGSNFWDAAPVTSESIIDFEFKHKNTGDTNCVFDSFAALAEGYGYDIDPNVLRSQAMNGTLNTDVVQSKEQLKTLTTFFQQETNITSNLTTHDVFNTAVNHMREGNPVSFFRSNGPDQPGHFVLGNKLIKKTFYNRRGGIRRIQYIIQVMSPGAQGSQYETLNNNLINAIFIHRHIVN